MVFRRKTIERRSNKAIGNSFRQKTIERHDRRNSFRHSFRHSFRQVTTERSHMVGS